MARTANRLFIPLDVGFFDDEKVIAAGERAAWLYLAMCTKVKLLDTDGVLTKGQIIKLAIPGWQARLKTLREHDLVVELPMQRDSYAIAAWFGWNEAKDARAERHQKDRDRKAQKAAAGE